MPIPDTPVVYGNASYDALYQEWLESGMPGVIENLLQGYRYRVYWPNGRSNTPTFVLEASSPNLGVAVGTQASWQRTDSLPIESV